MAVSEGSGGGDAASGDGEGITDHYHKKDFWIEENLKYAEPHFRLEKAALLVNKVARGRDCDLLDIGCGPATLRRLLLGNISYHGIDIAIHKPEPYLLELDFVEAPIRFEDKRFDIVIAQGVFEYVGDVQDEKFAEIAALLKDNGTFIASYVNFGHRDRLIYEPYNNVQSFADFQTSLARHFRIDKFFPTSHNWNHSEPGKKFMKTAQRHINVNIPFLSRVLAVEYFFICSPHDAKRAGGPPGY